MIYILPSVYKCMNIYSALKKHTETETDSEQ